MSKCLGISIAKNMSQIGHFEEQMDLDIYEILPTGHQKSFSAEVKIMFVSAKVTRSHSYFSPEKISRATENLFFVREALILLMDNIPSISVEARELRLFFSYKLVSQIP